MTASNRRATNAELNRDNRDCDTSPATAAADDRPCRHKNPNAAPDSVKASSSMFWLGTYSTAAVIRNNPAIDRLAATNRSSRLKTPRRTARRSPAKISSTGINHAMAPRNPTVLNAVITVENPMLKSRLQNCVWLTAAGLYIIHPSPKVFGPVPTNNCLMELCESLMMPKVALYDGRTSREEIGNTRVKPVFSAEPKTKNRSDTTAPPTANHGVFSTNNGAEVAVLDCASSCWAEPDERCIRNAAIPRIIEKPSIIPHTKGKLMIPSNTATQTAMATPIHRLSAVVRANSPHTKISMPRSPARSPRSFHLPIKFTERSAKVENGSTDAPKATDTHWKITAAMSAAKITESRSSAVRNVRNSVKERMNARNMSVTKSTVSVSIL